MSMTAIFNGQENISSMFQNIASAGTEMLGIFQDIGTTMNGSLETASVCMAETAETAQTAAVATAELAESSQQAEDALFSEAQAATEAGDAVAEMGEKSEEAGEKGEKSSNRASKAITAFKGVLVAAGITAAIVSMSDAFLDCSASAAVFETSIAKVSTLVDTSVVSMGQMSSEIRALSNSLGVSQNEIAESTYQAISGSVDAADAVYFVSEASKLAIGGFTNTTTAVNVLTTAVNAYGLEMEDIESISSMLITTQNLGKTSVSDLASSVGKVIPIAAAYNVQMDNISASYAILTKGGIETANATTYMRSMLNELGNTGSAVSEVLLAETGQSFAQLMDDGYSLIDVLMVLAETVDSDATAFANLWGSQTAGLGALALFNAGAEEFNDTLWEMQNSTGAVDRAFNTMADTTETAKNRMNTAMENMRSAYGEVLRPVFTDMYNAGAAAFSFAGDFIENHPVLVAGITAVAVGVAAVTASVVVYTVAVKAATLATSLWAASSAVALAPFTLFIGAAAAVTTGVVLLSNAFSKQDAEYKALTATSRKHYDALEAMNKKYEEALELHGDEREMLAEMRLEIEALDATYQSARLTFDDFQATNEALISSNMNVVSNYRESADAIDIQADNAIALIGKLEELSAMSDDTGIAQAQMLPIIDTLNEQIPGLGLSYDGLTVSMDNTIETMKSMAEAQAEQQRMAEGYDNYVDLLAEEAKLRKQIQIAEEETEAARKAYNDAGIWKGRTANELADYKAEEKNLRATLHENLALQYEYEDAYADYITTIENATVATDDYRIAVNSSLQTVSNDLQQLVDAYDEAYEAARTSIDATIGLFDTMATECELSAYDMMNALQSQVDYLDTYAENLRKAAEYGLDEGLIASLSDGSEESAGYINAIVSNLEGLDDVSAASFVDDFNDKFQEVTIAKDNFATTVAEIETDFNNGMDEIHQRLEEAIEDMSMEAEAAESARKTIQEYIDTVKSMTGEAHSAGAAVAEATSSALAGKGIATVGIYTGEVPAHANGTTDAEDVFIAGDGGGPELIVGKRGSTVFPAEETAKVINAVHSIAPLPAPNPVHSTSSAFSREEKKLVLEINGGGSISIDKSVDKEAVWEFVKPKLKDAFMGILTEDSYGEGDVVHGF